MNCRTIIIPELRSVISVNPVIKPGKISVLPVLMQLIQVEPKLSNSIVQIGSALKDSSIKVNADVVTEIRHYTSDVDYYEGSYEATPKTETSTQVFETREKMMRRNFLVYTIPTVEEYNESGGVTFIIGDNDHGS